MKDAEEKLKEIKQRLIQEKNEEIRQMEVDCRKLLEQEEKEKKQRQR